ncbi:thioester reductase domain-containing protein [Pseudomonas silvicola]|nr:thioester reductase domain-containing protein [Pseudomonas silvicola]
MSELLISRLTTWFDCQPSQRALHDAHCEISWGVLGHEARHLATCIGNRGMGTGQLIAVIGPRNVETVIALVGVMLSGAAYTIVEVPGLPFDASDRLAQIQPDLVIATGGFAPTCANALTYSLAGNGQPGTGVTRDAGGPEAAAYVLYTSGSTGEPKGVAVSHGNIAHYCQSLAQALAIPPGLSYAHVSTFAADLGNTGLFLMLWTGGSLYIADEAERKDPQALYRLLMERDIDVLKITPTQWRTVLAQIPASPGRRPALGWLLLGGEALESSLAQATLASGATARLINHYGPTETTVGVSIYPVVEQGSAGADERSVPIGKALGGTHFRVVDPEGNLCAPEQTGELFIGGPQVAIGYWKRPELNQGRFLNIAGMRYYRTGDRVVLDSDGHLRFMGRGDLQVKVNGYRVELSHIEAVLLSALDTRAVVVHHRFDDRDYLLCACEGLSRSAPELRTRLAQHLPPHMIPFSFYLLPLLPMNANGKLDRSAVSVELIKRFADDLGDVVVEHAETATPEDKIRAKFQRHCRTANVGTTSNFFDMGGDSLDAVRLISELQLDGFDVTARAFLSAPTLEGLFAQLDRERPCSPAQHHDAVEGPCAAGPAQAWFLQQDFREPNRWSQSMFIEAGVALNADRLREATAQVLQRHPLLRSRFHFDHATEQWVFEATDTYATAFSHVETGAVSDLDTLLNGRYTALEQNLNISTGRLFFLELIEAGGHQYLLAVAHHLVVDVVSWGLILDELTVHYTHPANATPLRARTYDRWVRHLHQEGPRWASDSAWWRQRLPDACSPSFEAGTENDAQTAWIAFTPAQTSTILENATATGVPIDRYLMGTYLQVANRHWPEPTVGVTIESHGRLSLNDDVDVSRTVGWFTAAFPVVLNAVDLLDTPAQVIEQALREIPDLGHSHALSGLPPLATRYCFNYLGRARLGLRDDLKLRPALVTYEGVRGQENHRVNQFKLTGRLVEDQLVLDLNFNGRATSSAHMQHFVQDFRTALLGEAANPHPCYLSPHSSSGALWNIPRQVLMHKRTQEDARARPAPSCLFLTGATGFLGVHVLRELLSHSQATIHCLVRAGSPAMAWQRLADTWAYYFKDDTPALSSTRVNVLVGDVCQLGFGLAQGEWDQLAARVDSVYHFAADTRLVGSRADMQRSIVGPTHELVRLLETGRGKSLHFMSTLAVGGCYRGDGPVRFDEDALDVGQSFLNEYERSKFMAEGVVRELAYRGHSAFIYRSGNVTGHSQTALFQRNADANRWVQCISAIAHAGTAPLSYDEPLVLSPIDTVAQGIVALSLDPMLPAGTYHVDSPFTVSANQFVQALQQLDIPVRRIDADGLQAALERSGKTALAPVALGMFWASREPRNVTYDHSRTLARLRTYGIEFPQLSSTWVDHFVRRLDDLGLFRQATPMERTASSKNRSQPQC